MPVEINKKRVVITGACATSTFLSNIVTSIESDSNSENEELVQELINVEENIRIRGKAKKVIRIEGFVENIIPRLTGKQFKEHFRMSPAVYDNLENRLGNLLVRQTATGRSTILIRKQLLATLWLLATPDSYRSIASRFDMGKSSLSHCVKRVIRALYSIAAEVITWPRDDFLLNMKAKFQRVSQLPNVIGAIDGSHIEIPAPETDPEMYNTRKCRYAIVLQAVCNTDMRFIDCFAGYPGSVGDLRVFRNSDLCVKIVMSF